MNRTSDLQAVLLGHPSTIEATYEIAKMAIELGIPGDFVECGVFAGSQSAAMARAIMDNWKANANPCFPRPERRVHLFDSFIGIPASGPEDRDYNAGGHQPGTAACSLEQVKAYMRRWEIPDELLVYHEGLFADTMKWGRFADGRRWGQHDIETISVLRLDGDLYASTKVCMEYLYPLVTPGGWVIVDDYNLDGCRKALHEFVMPAPIYFRKN